MKLFYQQHSRFHFDFHTDTPDFPPHIQNAVEILFLTDGECTAFCDKEKFRMQKGDIFISFPNQVHSFRDAKDARYYLFLLPIKPTLEPFMRTLTTLIPKSALLSCGQWEHTGVLPLIQQAHREQGSVLPEVMQAYMQIIFGKLLPLLSLQEQSAKKEGALKAILEYVGAHYQENLTRGQIAKALGYHENYISHIFSDSLKMTLPEYINSLRCYDAAQLLLGKEKTVSQIALDLGFGSVRNFNRAFQKEFGVSPVTYRKQ